MNANSASPAAESFVKNLRDGFRIFRMALVLDYSVSVSPTRHARDLSLAAMGLGASWTLNRRLGSDSPVVARARLAVDASVFLWHTTFALSDWRTSQLHKALIDERLSDFHKDAVRRIRG